MSSTRKQLETVEKLEKLLAAKKNILLNEALISTNPNDLLKANSMIQGVEERQLVERKSYLIDPHHLNSFLGYKDKAFSLSYSMLKRISYVVPIIRAVINTRIEQIAAFCEPQQDKYSTGFVIKKKGSFYNRGGDSNKLSKAEMKRIDELTQIVLDCGTVNKMEGDDFDSFTRKVINDSLTYDQYTYEIMSDRRNRPVSWIAADASTFRISDTIEDEYYRTDNGNIVMSASNKEKKFGYAPTYCQILDGTITADFYPWELAFGIRNPTTNIYSNGYGISEIEMLITTITSMLWADDYNRKFFSQGSAPKGLLKIKNGLGANGSVLSDFKQQWQAMMGGVVNAWKTPILEGDIEWIDLQKTNREMEFAKWTEYLIKITCAIFKIDPAEINFPLGGGAGDQKPLFEGDNEARLKHSKDKGLYPILKSYQRKFNKMIMSRLDPAYELVFCGLDGITFKDELEYHTKMVQNFMTIDEVRVLRGLKPIGEENGGNLILNSIYWQSVNAKNQQQMQEQQQQQMMNQQQQGQEGEEGGEEGGGEEENPFEKAFDIYMQKLVA